MPRQIYFLGVSDGAGLSEASPYWVNQPRKPNRTDPFWDGTLPAGPIPDPGNMAMGMGSGFPASMEFPRFVFDEPVGKNPFPDVFLHGRTLWLISDRAKQLFEEVDPAAFVFNPAETYLHEGGSGPKYWICDVVRFLDAVDEEKSDVFVEWVSFPGEDRPIKRVNLGLSGRDVFKSAVVGDHHVFRLMHSPASIFGDDVVVAAIRDAKLTGLSPYLKGALDV